MSPASAVAKDFLATTGVPQIEVRLRPVGGGRYRDGAHATDLKKFGFGKLHTATAGRPFYEAELCQVGG